MPPSFYQTLTNGIFAAVKFLQTSAKGANHIRAVTMTYDRNGMGDNRAIVVYTDHGAFEVLIRPAAPSVGARRPSRLLAGERAARETAEDGRETTQAVREALGEVEP